MSTPESSAKRLLTPNVKKLLFQIMAVIAIPPHSKVSARVAELFTAPGRLGEVYHKAMQMLEDSLAAVRNAPDNPYANDEEIADEILRQIELRKKGTK